jgi:DNA-binding MarR family transcriptional regulator
VPSRTIAPAEVAARLRLSATRLSRRLRREAEAGLSPSQLSVLAVIETHGPLTLGEVAEHERLAPPSITRTVGKLEADGLVTRLDDPSDRRVVRVEATGLGAELIAESRRKKTAWLTGRVGELDGDDRRRLVDALDVLDRLVDDA